VIREISIHSDPFYGDIAQALKFNIAKLIQHVDHPRKENISQVKTFD
jgi:hypothetical protein